jgi:hypothetical protein
MKRRGLKLALLGLTGFWALVSAGERIRYMGQGIAYGGIVGLPGREQDLAVFGSRAMTALRIAVVLEALAIATVSWVFTSHKSVWVRLCIALVFAAVVNIFTFAVVRGM